MEPIFKIELPAPESGNKTLRKHWSKRKKDNEMWAWQARSAINKLKIKIPKQPRDKMRYFVFTLESFKPQDDNNFQLSIKGLVDEFQEGRTVDCIIDDSPDYCRVFYIPIKTRIKKRKMFLEVYEEDIFIKKILHDKSFQKKIFSTKGDLQ